MLGCFPTEHHKRFKARKARFCLGKNEKCDSLDIKISRQLGQANKKIIMIKDTLCTGLPVSIRGRLFLSPQSSPIPHGFAGPPGCCLRPEPCLSAATPACTSMSLHLCDSTRGSSPQRSVNLSSPPQGPAAWSFQLAQTYWEQRSR